MGEGFYYVDLDMFYSLNSIFCSRASIFFDVYGLNSRFFDPSSWPN